MTNTEENVLNNTLDNIELYMKLLGNCSTYEKDEQCARVVKDLSEAYLNILQACKLREAKAD